MWVGPRFSVGDILVGVASGALSLPVLSLSARYEFAKSILGLKLSNERFAVSSNSAIIVFKTNDIILAKIRT